MKPVHVLVVFMATILFSACAYRTCTLSKQDDSLMSLAKVGVYADWVESDQLLTSEPKLFAFGQGGRTCTAVLNIQQNGEVQIRHKSCI